MRPLFTASPWRAIGTAIYADQPQDIDSVVYIGFREREPERGYLIAESIPHKPTRDLIASAPELYDFIATLENDDGAIPAWLWSKRDRLLARARGEQPAEPRHG